MHPFSTMTDKTNNWKFSPCSTSQIHPVLIDKAHCFASTKLPYCGDGEFLVLRISSDLIIDTFHEQKLLRAYVWFVICWSCI